MKARKICLVGVVLFLSVTSTLSEVADARTQGAMSLTPAQATQKQQEDVTLVSTKVSTTLICSSGTVSLKGGLCAAACGPGRFASDCVETWDPATSSVHGQSVCTACPLGYYDQSPNLECTYCTECPSGYVADRYGSTECRECATNCPPPSRTVSNACTGTADVTCQCPVGFYTDTFVLPFTASLPNPCRGCDPSQGQYQDEANSRTCKTCTQCSGTGIIEYSPCTATGNRKCQCAPGFFGTPGPFLGPAHNCTACPSGKYQSTSGQSTCNVCGDNSVSQPAAAVCKCLPGFSGSPCTKCSIGKYKATTSTLTCQACPTHATTAATGTTTANSCLCDKGYSGPNPNACEPCAIGSYKDVVGFGSCVSCDGMGTTVSGGADSVEKCVCVPGKERLAGACVACSKGYYKATHSNDDCSQCPVDSTTVGGGASGQTDCVCAAGFKGDPFHAGCSRCVDGKHKATAGAGPCVECSDSNTVSVDGVHCVCKPGFTQSATTGQCEPCGEGTYKDVPGNDSCQVCPTESTTNGTAAADRGSCFCNPGFAGDLSLPGSSCSGCPSGSWSGSGQVTCSSCSGCPLNSVTAQLCSGADSGKCKCAAGFASLGDAVFSPHSGTSCTACPSGYFSPRPATTHCQECSVCGDDNTEFLRECTTTTDTICTCKAGSYSLAKRTSAPGIDSLHCLMCPSGYYGANPSQTYCEACEVGKYAKRSNSTECRNCPFGSHTTTQGATSSTQCVCKDGKNVVDGECPGARIPEVVKAEYKSKWVYLLWGIPLFIFVATALTLYSRLKQAKKKGLTAAQKKSFWPHRPKPNPSLSTQTELEESQFASRQAPLKVHRWS